MYRPRGVYQNRAPQALLIEVPVAESKDLPARLAGSEGRAVLALGRLTRVEFPTLRLGYSYLRDTGIGLPAPVHPAEREDDQARDEDRYKQPHAEPDQYGESG